MIENLGEKLESLENLVRIYETDIRQFQQWTYNETQVRVDFLNPFFQLLGWDVMNEKRIATTP